MRPFFSSLRERLLLLIILTLIPVLGLIVYSAMGQRQAAAIEIERNAMNLVRLAAKEQAQLISNTHQMLATLSLLPAVRSPDVGRECSRLLADLRRTHAYYTNIGVASPAGNVYCSALPLSDPIDISDRSYFRRALEGHAFGIGDHQVGRITGTSAINFGYPVIDEKGDLLAVVYAALSLSWLNNLISTIELPVDSTVQVIDSMGTILARYPDPQVWSGQSLTESPLIKAVLEHQAFGSMELQGLDGVRRLYTFAPMHDGASSVYVGVGIPKAVAFAAADQALVRNLILLSIVALFTLAAAWIGGNLFVLRPVRAITTAARRLAGGDMSARTGLSYNGAELGQLARDFDAMAAALKSVNRALKTLSAGNRTLTRAIDERELLHQMCRTIVDVGGYRFALVAYLHEEAKSLQPVAHAGFEGIAGGSLQCVDIPGVEEDDNLIAQVLLSRTPAAVRHCTDDRRLLPWADCREYEACASGAVFPLNADGTLVGILAIYSSEPDAFVQEEIDLLQESAEDLSYGIAALRTREDHRKATETIMKMAYYDGLTGLPNHVFLEERLGAAISEAGAQIRPLALLFLDIDRFQEINTALGFSQGDLLLQETARRLRAAVGEDDLVARMRGDEFAALLSSGDAIETAGRILAALDKTFVSGNLTLAISASVGIALFPEHGADVEHLVRHADVAMREAKHSDRRVAIYNASQDEYAARRLTLAGELKHGLEHDELVLYYQPKLDMKEMRICGAEALVRWMHPQRGMIPPNEFITLAEHTGLIKPLTDWVLDAALQQAQSWRREGLALPIAVNLSVRNLQDAELMEKLGNLFTRLRASPDWLELELTESGIMEDPGSAMNTLDALSEFGINLYIDDFGTGYSSLAYLQRLPVDAMKIDKSFVIDMLKDANLAKIVRSTIDLAHDLDLKVVAEGVETQAVWDRLVDLGCDVAQGYHISPPLPADAFRRWAYRHRTMLGNASGPAQAAGRRSRRQA